MINLSLKEAIWQHKTAEEWFPPTDITVSNISNRLPFKFVASNFFLNFY